MRIFECESCGRKRTMDVSTISSCSCPQCGRLMFPLKEREADLSVPCSAGLGVPLGEEKDPDKLRDMAAKLWKMLDDIDTASDIAKSNDVFYRKMVEEVQGRTHKILTSDGYDLFVPKEKHP